MNLPTTAILFEIADERARQDAKWGEQCHPDADPVILRRLAGGNHPLSSPAAVAQRLAEHHEIPSAARAKFLCDSAASEPGGRTWVGIAVEELAEALEATVEDRARVREELIQLAAVVVAWVEDIDRAAESATTPAVPEKEPTS